MTKTFVDNCLTVHDRLLKHPDMFALVRKALSLEQFDLGAVFERGVATMSPEVRRNAAALELNHGFDGVRDVADHEVHVEEGVPVRVKSHGLDAMNRDRLARGTSALQTAPDWASCDRPAP